MAHCSAKGGAGVLDAGSDCLREAFAFAEDVDRLSNRTVIMQRVLRVTRRFGLTGLTIGGLPRAGEQFHDLTLATQLPEEWHKHYIERHLFAVDPVARRLASAVTPFETGAVDYGLSGEPRAVEVMEGRRAFGQIEGYIVPVPRYGNKGYVWMSGVRSELPPGSKPALHLVALCAFDSINRLVSCPDREPVLTERQREVLMWIAAGKSSWAIGEILGIAKRTVDEYASLATRKLGAANRTQAVAIALRDHEITV
jgi:LuxR family quorum sensing-dependent transcriptional regulator